MPEPAAPDDEPTVVDDVEAAFELGSAQATTPAVAKPAKPIPAVSVESRPRPRLRAASRAAC